MVKNGISSYEALLDPFKTMLVRAISISKNLSLSFLQDVEEFDKIKHFPGSLIFGTDEPLGVKDLKILRSYLKKWGIGDALIKGLVESPEFANRYSLKYAKARRATSGVKSKKSFPLKGYWVRIKKEDDSVFLARVIDTYTKASDRVLKVQAFPDVTWNALEGCPVLIKDRKQYVSLGDRGWVQPYLLQCKGRIPQKRIISDKDVSSFVKDVPQEWVEERFGKF